MRLATWNVNSLKARLVTVEPWIDQVQPDVLCLQETKLADDAFPALTFEALGYECAHHGEGRWNGVAILSRVGLDDVVSRFASEPLDRDARLLTADCGGIRVYCCYVPNGRAVDDPHYEFKLAWMDALAAHVADACSPEDAVVVCGDLNIAPEDRDVYDPEAFEGETHVTEEERARFRALVDWGLEDVFRRHHDAERLFSWWDYRGGNFHKGKGMRIDHILATRPVADRTAAPIIDRNARKGSAKAGNPPSDHAPVVVDLLDGA